MSTERFIFKKDYYMAKRGTLAIRIDNNLYLLDDEYCLKYLFEMNGANFEKYIATVLFPIDTDDDLSILAEEYILEKRDKLKEMLVLATKDNSINVQHIFDIPMPVSKSELSEWEKYVTQGITRIMNIREKIVFFMEEFYMDDQGI